MTLDRIWSGWRSAYVAEAATGANLAGDGTVFTRILAAVDRGELTDETAYVVRRGERCFAILNAYPYGTGHLLLLPYREVAELEDLDDDESAELWAMVGQAVRAVKRAYSPQGVNVGFNLGAAAGAGVPNHVHAHVLPRWDADSNFMTAVAEARVLPEPLSTTWRRLVDAWPG
ncbi:MAG: HIT family protein [Acidimicrobiia bacterium]